MAKSKLTIETIGGSIIEAAIDPAPNVTIKKAQIRDGLFLNVEFSEALQSGTNAVKKTCSAPIHDDLKSFFAKLNSHLASICEQYGKSGSIDEDVVSCSGFAITKNADGVVLIGDRSVEDGVVNLVSPAILWASEYTGTAKLSLIIEACKMEVKQYLFNDKHKPTNQIGMFQEEVDKSFGDE